MLSPRLQLKVSQKQILTPGLVQMVTVLQLNRLELKDMITQEIAENPVLEESADGVEELTPEEVQAILEAERTSEPSDQTILETVNGAAGAGARVAAEGTEASAGFDTTSALDLDASSGLRRNGRSGARARGGNSPSKRPTRTRSTKSTSEPFFDDYLDPGYKSPGVGVRRKAFL